MHSYETITEALKDLEVRGFKHSFVPSGNSILCKALGKMVRVGDFKIVEVFRFKGGSSPIDEEVIYAVESSDGIQGIIVSAYGSNADNISSELTKKLRNALK
jgi:hypothetical protein